MTRDQALVLLQKYNDSEHLIKHALTVEAVLREFARMGGEDEEYWGNVGLLHDIDYERWPDEHCKKAAGILREEGVPEDIIHAVVSHGYGICSDVKPERYMEKVLYAIDELSGLITASVLMRPSRSVLDLEVKSVKKKFKDKGFAAKIDREIILRGCEMMDMPLDEVIAHSIAGMRAAADELDLKGTL